jgi:hypothetical protein
VREKEIPEVENNMFMSSLNILMSLFVEESTANLLYNVYFAAEKVKK